MERNPLAYARESSRSGTAAKQERFRTVVAPLTRDPMHRIYAADRVAEFRAIERLAG